MPSTDWRLIGGSGTLVTAPSAAIPTPGSPSFASIPVVTDTAPDASGNPQKLVTVVYTPPSPLGTFSGIDIWLDNPDTSGQLSIADGTIAADGTVPAVGVFSPTLETFFPYIAGNFQTSFVIPAPNTPQLARVYITPASKNVSVPPVQHGQAGESPNKPITIYPPNTATSGREFAPLVQSPAMNSGTGWASNPLIQVSESGDQHFVYSIVWTWPKNDPSFNTLGGVNIILQNNTNGLQQYPGDVVVSAAGIDTSQPVTVLPGTTSYTAYLLSFDIQGNSNTLVAGVTPSVTFSVTRSTGVAGSEFAHLVTADGVHAFVVVTPENGADGSQLLRIDGWWKNLNQGDAGYDPQFGGAQIVVDKADGNGPVWSVVKGTLSPISNDISQPATVATWTFYIRSIDINGKGNTIVPGTTPSVAISVGNTSGQLNLGKALASSFSVQFSIVAGAFTVNALNANIITTGVLKVGNNGSGFPVELSVFDHLNNPIGWIGDDTGNSGFVGAWFKQCRIGGTSPSNAPLIADTSGNVTINGATFTLNATGATTTLNNSSFSTAGTVGAMVKNNTAPSRNIIMSDSGFYIRAQDQSTYIGILASAGSSGANNEEVRLVLVGQTAGGYNKTIALQTGGANTPFISVTSSTGNDVRLSPTVPAVQINGIQVLTSQQTGPGTASGFADSVAQTWANALLTGLRAHGLVN